LCYGTCHGSALAESGSVIIGAVAEGGQLADKDLRINEQIRVREVRLIDDQGEQKGIIPTLEAIRTARELGLDLVEVAPQSIPPVCKLLNYGKFKFEQEKKVKDSRKKTKIGELKEIRMQPKIAGHDLDFKSEHVRDFLEQGFKVKVTIRFRGRELAHTEIGEQVLKRVLGKLEGYYIMEKSPLMEGRFMSMILQPKISIIKKPAAEEPVQADGGQQ
jgi:translation initiation factor IF-3